MMNDVNEDLSRKYLKTDVAHCFYPNVHEGIAFHYLKTRIISNDKLRNGIYTKGGDVQSKWWSQYQVDLIVQCLGKPRLNLEDYVQERR